MKYVIKNVSRDKAFANKRRLHPTWVTKRPYIIGQRLMPRHVMTVEDKQLNETEKQNLNRWIDAGVIQVSVLGGGPVKQFVIEDESEEFTIDNVEDNFDESSLSNEKALEAANLIVSSAGDDSEPSVVETVLKMKEDSDASLMEQISAKTIEHTVEGTEDPLDVELNKEEEKPASDLDVGDVIEEEPSDKHSKEDLENMNNKTLREMISVLKPDTKAGSWKKSKLVDFILEHQ